MSRTVRWTATTLILVLVSTAAVQAAPLPGPAGAPASLFDTAWEWLASLFVSQEKEEETIPPAAPADNPPRGNGEGAKKPDDPSPTPNPQAGGEMDPNG